jgi:hypothetical protein
LPIFALLQILTYICAEDKESLCSPNRVCADMPLTYPAWLTSAAGALRRLADPPWPLFVLLLALNAITRPCSVTAHDARLYSLQVINVAENGAYADDVFLRFGSQDQFSLFSRVVAPMVAMLGLRLAFFALYLVFNTLFILGLFRLVRTLVADPLVSTLALVYLVTAPLSYGGHDIFAVHEQFFTPRLIGTTLTLFALERILRQQFAVALILLIGGALIHPLMAFGGVMIWTGCVAWTYLPTRVFIGLVAASLIGGVVLLSLPIAERLFGAMDDEWHQMIRLTVGYNYPDAWSIKDWINLAVSFALPIAGCCALYHDDPIRRRFLAIVALAGAVGFLTTLAASMMPYALLFQGQPYRVLWILKVLQIPLGFLLIARWSQAPARSAQIAALGLVGYFCVTNYIAPESLVIASAVVVSICISRLADEQTNRGWWWYATARGFALGAIGWMAYRWWFFVSQREMLARHFDLNEWVLFELVSPIFAIVSLCGAVRLAQGFRIVRWSAIAVSLLIPIGLFAMETSPTFTRDQSRLGSDIAFLGDIVQSRSAEVSRHPSIYCPINRTDLIWIDVKATSYFGILQTAGVMYNRRTAEEIQRRASVVAKFEMARERKDMIIPDEAQRRVAEKLFGVSFDCPPPTQDDLIRLCQEPGLDYVAIQQEFPGLYAATNGRLFVYECCQVKHLPFSVRAETPGTVSPALQRER